MLAKRKVSLQGGLAKITDLDKFQKLLEQAAKLREINLINMNFEPNICTYIIDWLRDKSHSYLHVRSLCLNRNDLGDIGA